MSSDKKRDSLGEVVKEIENYCREEQFSLFYGWTREENQRAVIWDLEHDAEWQSFLAIAKALEVKVLYIELTRFEESDLEEAVAEEDNEKASTLGTFKNKVGQLERVELFFFHGGILHVYELEAEWFTQFQNLVSDNEDFNEEEELDQELVDEWAQKLANDERYASCKSKTQRTYILEQLAGKKFQSLPTWQIVKAAERIYFLEVRPKEEAKLKQEAQKLREQGVNLNTIAQKLGISRERLRALLME